MPTEQTQAVWNPLWDPETLDAIYHEAKGMQSTFTEWADSLDTKLVAVFGASSAFATIVPALLAPPLSDVTHLLMMVGTAAWLLAALEFRAAYTPTQFKLSPNTNVVMSEPWIGLHRVYFKLYRLQAMARSFDYNTATLRTKAVGLKRVLFWTAIQVAALALAALSRLWGPVPG